MPAGFSSDQGPNFPLLELPIGKRALAPPQTPILDVGSALKEILARFQLAIPGIS